MGFTNATFHFYNATDIGKQRRGEITGKQVRKATRKVLIDSGAKRLVVNSKFQKKLGLQEIGMQPVRLANGSVDVYPLLEPVEIRFKNRMTICNPILMPDADEILVGVIPLEGMDVMVDPLTEQLILPPNRLHSAVDIAYGFREV
jgi:predicted aspartyl protease